MNANLIEKALALTGKTMEDMNGYIDDVLNEFGVIKSFSIEKFFAYLLSPSFIEKYTKLVVNQELAFAVNIVGELDISDVEKKMIAGNIGEAICSYQSGDSSKLINLLEKI